MHRNIYEKERKISFDMLANACSIEQSEFKGSWPFDFGMRNGLFGGGM